MSDVRTAERIAREAHSGQVDKTGAPYIEHCRRVAERMVFQQQKAAAWLHDVLEDTDVTEDDLEQNGVPRRVIDAVVALTHLPGEPRAAYMERVRLNPMAHGVKLADIADNIDPRRLLCLDTETMLRLMRKYAAALDALDAARFGVGEYPKQ